ncbi:MAG TPA: Rieske (2Fe-2S) protein [Gemmatimonadaceae bacterium]|nr:Rieske (2Fe-2S) protein [Gemmatimonadaceae bacterium]
MSDEPKAHSECEQHDCIVPTDRRRFLRDSFVSMAGALIAVGMSRSTALAMPLEFTEARSRSGALRSYGVPPADGAQIDRDNEVILVRWQNAVYAFALSCPHQNTALHWDERDHGFQCPKHHSRFQADGSYIAGSGRATRNMDRYAIQLQSGNVAVDLDTLYQEDTDGPQWAAAVVHLGAGTK